MELKALKNFIWNCDLYFIIPTISFYDLIVLKKNVLISKKMCFEGAGSRIIICEFSYLG